MKKLLVLSMLLMAGCATSQALEIGPNQWLIQSRSITEIAAMEDVVAGAAHFCSLRSRPLHVLKAQPFASSWSGYGHQQLVFTCDGSPQTGLPPIPSVTPPPDEKNLKPTWMP